METDKQDLDDGSLPRPLAGIRVLDLTVALAGPYCSLLLAGLGADVIKIEGPGGSDLSWNSPPFYGPEGLHFDAKAGGGTSLSILSRARNKRSITLDLKTDEGRAIFLRLARISDVVVENLSDGTADRLGVGYEEVRAANSSIVYASISGLGEANPFPGLKAMDIIVQALSGVMDVTGFMDGPPMRFGLPIADLVAPLYTTSGILAAIIQRGRTGSGQHVKVSMLDCMASLLAVEHFDVLQRSGFAVRTGNHQNRLCPFGVYAARDGHVAIAAVTDGWFRSLVEAMGQPELAADPRFSGRGPRVVNADALNALIEAWTRALTAEEVMTELHAKRRVPCARVRSAGEVLHDPMLRATGAVQDLVHTRLGPIDVAGTGLPIRFSGAHTGFDQPAPELGASNRDVYGGLLGISGAELEELEARGVI